MTLAQRIVIAGDDGKSVMALSLAALLLFGVIALFLLVGLRPAPAEASAHAAAAPVAKAAQDPACAAALDRARDTRGLPADEAIARSTAMLRACHVH
jgi:hypothetical protein